MMTHGVVDASNASGYGKCVKMVSSKQQSSIRKTVGVMGSRRIFAPAFKLKVLDSYRNDIDCRGNQRATARKYGIHRRQIQKWLQCEDTLRSSCADPGHPSSSPGRQGAPQVEGPLEAPAGSAHPAPALNLSLTRLHGDEQQGSLLQHQHSPSSPVQYTLPSPQNTASMLPHGPSPPTYPEFHQDHHLAEDQKYYLLNNNYELYQPLAAYHSPAPQYPQDHSPCTDFPSAPGAEEDSRSQISPAPMIKLERASPDSAATPGPCDAGAPGSSFGSPPPPCTSLSPHHATSAVHFERTRTSPAPTRALTDACVDSENPHEDGGRVHEGIAPRDRVYNEPPASNRSAPARSGPPGSPYSGPLSSGRSSISSDSETDALDYTTTTLNPSGDLARRRSFSLRFKLDVLDAFHRDAGVAGNQRATARKYGINRRQVQKWLSQETELRGEIALRGGTSRQRLGPAAESLSSESPVDLRTNLVPEHREDPSCCYSPDIASPQRQPPYYASPESSEVLSDSSLGRACTLSCCTDALSCYPRESFAISEAASPKRTSCYQSLRSCYSSNDPAEASRHFSAKIDCPASSCYVIERAEPSQSPSTTLKRPCALSCCSYGSSPKRLCAALEESTRPTICGEQEPPQEAPLCLVKPKRTVEPVTSTVPTPPALPAVAPSSKRDAILFKPYLDNPIAKPAEEHSQHNGSSPNYNNNNNCQSICNLNVDRNHEGYALELSLRVPVSWGVQQTPFSELPRARSAFVRYPATPHYT